MANLLELPSLRVRFPKKIRGRGSLPENTEIASFLAMTKGHSIAMMATCFLQSDIA